MKVVTVAITVVLLAATALAGVRWLRVAQREHYLPGSAARFAARWWLLSPNPPLVLVAFGSAVATPVFHPAGLITAGVVAVGPIGLGLRGTSKPLAWTARLKTLAACSAVVAVLPVLVALLIGTGTAVCLAAIVALLAPVVVDGAAAICQPIEARKGERFVDQARSKLDQVRPEVVAITGSYGKTSTKGYLAHLLRGTRTVVPSPASFNNRAGLARAVNEHLLPGTEVFIAEMGTYGPGEIAALCEWVKPRLAAIVAIGPVHLERMKTEDGIVAAKSEIFATAEICVLNVDDARLAALADRLSGQGKGVVRISAADTSVDVAVVPAAGGIGLWVGGGHIGTVAGVEHPAVNVAVAVALALRLGVTPAEVLTRLPGLPVAANRLAPTAAASGALLLDDTYNANPAGARRGLEVLAAHATAGARRVVVTPGMVELGVRQDDENAAFAEAAVRAATHLLIVGRTNRTALQAGAARGPTGCTVILEPTQADAIEWVKTTCTVGDVVLYENHLPDHFA